MVPPGYGASTGGTILDLFNEGTDNVEIIVAELGATPT